MTQDEIRRQELSDFLRARRARISPADIGLPAPHRRRTPGLRREEVAQLAGMSATWYTWLEQRRPISVSPGMLDNLARVLRLNPVERMQLFRLARREPFIDSMSPRETISPRFQRMLDQSDMPAFVMGRRWDVLAWNRAARAFLLDFEQVPPDERNMVWLTFTHPALRSLIVEWSTRAKDTLARFRTDYGRYAGDSHFVQLVDRLNAVSPEFAQWWPPRHDVLPITEGCLEYNHPLVGRMIVDHMTFAVVDNPELRVIALLPAAEANSMKKMRKVIAAFRGGARARVVALAASTAKPARLRMRTTTSAVPTTNE
jgi:transcriptional regulator with XRE-family HTH domain